MRFVGGGSPSGGRTDPGPVRHETREHRTDSGSGLEDRGDLIENLPSLVRVGDRGSYFGRGGEDGSRDRDT